MDFSGMLAALGRNVDDADSVGGDVMATTLDRARMMDPNQQGPRLPDTPTPQENSMLTGMMGSMAPVEGAADAVLPRVSNNPTLKEIIASSLSNHAAQTGTMDELNMAQQAASREADFADRFRQALRQRKMQALQKLSGR